MKGPGISLLATLAVIALASCDGLTAPMRLPAEQRTPTIVGIIETTADTGDARVAILADGTRFELIGANGLFRSGAFAAGSLLVAGEHDGRWYFYTEPQSYDPDCYPVSTRGREDGDAVITELGVRLPKAPGFAAPGDTDGVYDTPAYTFCLDDQGRVASYGG